MNQLASDNAASQRSVGERSIHREAELLAINIADLAALPQAGNNFADLQQVIDSALNEYEEVRWLQIIEVLGNQETGQVLVETKGAPAAPTARDELSKELATGGIDATVWRESREGDEHGRIYATYVSMNKRSLGELRMAVSTEKLEAELAASIEAAYARTRDSIRTVLLMAGVILIGGILLAMYQGYRIARPLQVLNEQTTRIANGDLEHRIHVGTRDEMGVLAHNFNDMVERLRLFMHEQQEKALLEREMTMARDFQRSIIPPPELVQFGPLKLLGHCMPAFAAGGDWWHYSFLSGDRILVLAGDATGHGIDSAMVAGAARGALEALIATRDERLLEPENVLRAIDAAISNIGDHKLLMSCMAAVLDPIRGTVDCANAGYRFPYLLHLDDNRTVSDVTVLTNSGNQLGFRHGALDINTVRYQLRAGDIFLCFSDGLVERADATGRVFGDRRMYQAVLHQSIGQEPEALPALRDRVLSEVDRFAAGMQPDDDVTFVVCMYDPESTAVPSFVEAAS